MSAFTVKTSFRYLNGNFFGACYYKGSAGPCLCGAEVMSGSILSHLPSQPSVVM